MSTHTNHTTTGTPAKVVAGSLLGGIVSAITLVALPFAGGSEATITGAILIGFAIGWALLAQLSMRSGDGAHRWAAVPATALGLSGAALIILTPNSQTLDTLGWIWPPLLLALVLWMTAQARREPPTRRRSWLLYPVFAVMALAAIGGSYETLQASSDSGAAPVAGDRLVDVGGHRLNIRCTGSGSPTVVLEPGLGESASAIAKWIAPEVARTTRVCVYDRAGHGRSDVAPDADAARDLHVLLERAHVPGPYVLAGHSLGGMFVLSYAHRYPSQVGGVVLLDSMHPRQTHTRSGHGPRARRGPDGRADRPRTAARRPQGRRAGGPSTTVRARRRADARPTGPGGPAQDPRQPPLGCRHGRHGLAAGLDPAPERPGNALDPHFHRTVAGSTHQSLIDDPKDAAASSRAIRDVVVAVRNGGA